MRLDPFHPHFAPLMIGEACYLLKQYDEAQRWLGQCTARAPNHQYGHAFLAATYAQLGRLEDARVEAAEVLRVNPKYSIRETQKRVSFFKRSEDMEHLSTGCEKRACRNNNLIFGNRPAIAQRIATMRNTIELRTA